MRVIGVDTPEIAHRDAPAACGGDDAAAFVRRALLGQRVRLATGVEPRDRYGRTLAGVTVLDGPLAGADLAATLADRGLARPLPIPPNDANAGDIARRVRAARAAAARPVVGVRLRTGVPGQVKPRTRTPAGGRPATERAARTRLGPSSGGLPSHGARTRAGTCATLHCGPCGAHLITHTWRRERRVRKPAKAVCDARRGGSRVGPVRVPVGRVDRAPAARQRACPAALDGPPDRAPLRPPRRCAGPERAGARARCRAHPPRRAGPGRDHGRPPCAPLGRRRPAALAGAARGAARRLRGARQPRPRRRPRPVRRRRRASTSSTARRCGSWPTRPSSIPARRRADPDRRHRAAHVRAPSPVRAAPSSSTGRPTCGSCSCHFPRILDRAPAGRLAAGADAATCTAASSASRTRAAGSGSRTSAATTSRASTSARAPRCTSRAGSARPSCRSASRPGPRSRSCDLRAA